MKALMNRIRTAVDGSYFILKPNPELEAELDAKYLRQLGSLRWYPFPRDKKHLVSDNTFKDSICYIVGKGPSLDNLDASIFLPDIPIVCINQSIHKIESLQLTNPLYCIQQDKGLKDLCHPKDATLWVSYEAREFYPSYHNKAVFMIPEYGAYGQYTATLATKIVQEFDVTGIEYIGFDACVTGKTEYAKCIERPLKGDGKRFINACVEIRRALEVPFSFLSVE